MLLSGGSFLALNGYNSPGTHIRDLCPEIQFMMLHPFFPPHDRSIVEHEESAVEPAGLLVNRTSLQPFTVSRSWSFFVAGLALLLFSGCPSSKTTPEASQGFSLKGVDRQAATLTKQSDQLGRVVNQIRSDTVADWTTFEESITRSLNTAWNVAQKANAGQAMTEVVKSWEEPALLESLPAAYQDSLWIQNIASENFIYTDAYYLQEQQWLGQIVERVLSDPDQARFAYLTHAGRATPATLQEVVQQLHPDLSLEEATQLSNAWRLFDWSVRNVSGDAFYQTPKREDADSENLQAIQADKPLSFAGVRGPGYTQYLWQTLSYGRGDSWQQGHVFLQLARNANLKSCVVGVPQIQPTALAPRVAHPDLVPWAIGVLIGQRMYMFDPRLGMPVHLPETYAIATLEQCVNDPAVLRWQSLTPQESASDESVYPFTAADLRDLVALIDYPVESYALRTKFVEDNLTGQDRLPLYFSPQPLADALSANPQIANVWLWALPVEINVFRASMRDAQARAVRDRFLVGKLQWSTLGERYFDEFPLLRESRILYLSGKFSPDQRGLHRDCLQEFQSIRYSDDDIAKIVTDRDLQTALGLFRTEQQDAEEFRQAVSEMQVRMKIVRADAQMFLALAHQELNNYSTSQSWLRLVPKFDSTDKWKRLTLYLQGRNYEAMGNYEQAGQAYQRAEKEFSGDQSPRDFGSLIRWRIISERTP